MVKYTKKRKLGIYLGDPKVKGVIIGSAALIVIILGIFIWTWIKSNDDGRLAILKYNFNNFYDSSFDHNEPVESFDGLNDILSKLSMSEMDSDSDGISDNIERILDLNPNSDMTDGVMSDSDCIFTRSMNFEEGEIVITGHANIYKATIDKLSINAVRSNAGVFTSPYELYCDGDFDSAVIRFRYDPTKLNIARINTNTLHVYKFDPYTRTYASVGGDVTISESSVDCAIDSNGVYMLGTDQIIDKSAEAYVSENTNIHLIIDNSGSLYESTDAYQSEENDVDFKRLSFAKKFVSDYADGAKFAISVFTYDFETLCDFDSDKSHVMMAIDSIRSLGAGFDGTSVERAMVMGLDSFSDNMSNERNIIVLLTDGISTNSAGYTIDSILMRAKAKNVTVITISLGQSYDRELLESIADNTGGRYYSILESNLLENLHLVMKTSMADDIVDDDANGEPDSYMLYDTGFDLEKDSLNFSAYRNEDAETVDFGMALFAKDWFRNDLDRDARNMIGDALDLSEPLHKYSSQMLSQYSKPENYLEFRSTGDTLRIGDIRNEAVSKGWKAVIIPYTETLTGWKKVELFVPGLSTGLIKSSYGNTDDLLFRLIDYYDKKLSQCKPYAIIDENSVNKTKQILGGGNPMVMKLSWIDGDQCLSRYVLLVGLRRDLDDPNVFKLKAYDVIEHSIDNVILTRKKVILGTGMNTVYVGNWNNKTVAITGCPE